MTTTGETVQLTEPLMHAGILAPQPDKPKLPWMPTTLFVPLTAPVNTLLKALVHGKKTQPNIPSF